MDNEVSLKENSCSVFRYLLLIISTFANLIFIGVGPGLAKSCEPLVNILFKENANKFVLGSHAYIRHSQNPPKRKYV